jgi:hypothetical protein
MRCSTLNIFPILLGRISPHKNLRREATTDALAEGGADCRAGRAGGPSHMGISWNAGSPSSLDGGFPLISHGTSQRKMKNWGPRGYPYDLGNLHMDAWKNRLRFKKKIKIMLWGYGPANSSKLIQSSWLWLSNTFNSMIMLEPNATPACGLEHEFHFSILLGIS